MKIVRVDGTRLHQVARDPQVGDYEIGVSLRPHGSEAVVLHNTFAVDGVRLGRETVWPTHHKVVRFNTDFTVDGNLYRIIR